MPDARATAPSSVARLAAPAFQKYAPALHRYVLRRLRRPEDAADLTQAIFERFLEVDNSDLIRNPQAYLFGIASHVVSEARFKEEHNPVTYDSEALEHVTGSLEYASQDDLAERLGLQRDLEQALATLSDTHRAVLLMVKRDGLSYEEAAQSTHLTVNTVATYVMEARAKVKLSFGRR